MALFSTHTGYDSSAYTFDGTNFTITGSTSTVTFRDAGVTTGISAADSANQLAFIGNSTIGVTVAGNFFSSFDYTVGGTTYTGYAFDLGGDVWLFFDQDAPPSNGDVITPTFTGETSVSYDDLFSAPESVGETGGPNLGNADTMLGNEGNDTIVAKGGADTVLGGAGDDSLSGGDGRDSIMGEDGNDSISGGSRGDRLFGGEGNDTILGGTNTSDTLGDYIEGGGGNDSLIGNGENDTILGGLGDDTIFGDEAIIINPDVDVAAFRFDRTDVDTTGSSAAGGVGNEQVGDYIIYNNVATTAEGIEIDARIIYVSNDDADSGAGEIGVDLNNDDILASGPLAGQLDPNIVLINTDEDAAGNNVANTATQEANSGVNVVIRVEFYVSDTFNHGTQTGTLVALNGTFSFQDLDRDSAGSFEQVRVDTSEFDTYTIADPADPVGTGLTVTDLGSAYTFAGTQNNTSQDDPDAQVNLTFTDQDDFTVTLRSRLTRSGYTFDTEDFSVATDSVILNGDGPDSLVGGEGADAIYGGAGSDTIEGGEGDDTLFGDSGNDSISGGDGADSLEGSVGSDTLRGGTDGSFDTLNSGNDDDVVFWTQNEEIDGGFGSDTFTFEDDGDPGTGTVTIVGGEDPDGSDIDVLDITGSLGGLSSIQYFTDAGLTNPSPGNAPTENGIYTTQDGTVVRFTEIESVICFTRGTRLSTPTGLRAIEGLRVGDLIVTRDHGLQPIRWIGRRLMPAIGRFAPVRFAPGVLGNRDALEVSPQHRMLVQNADLRLSHGSDEVLIPACHMLDGAKVQRRERGFVEYFHILCDRHEIVFADGVPSESFHPGEMGLASIDAPAREELLSIFPDLAAFGAESYGPSARQTLRRFESEGLFNLAG